MKMELTAEEFLREKLESEISSFGDGTSEFHTRDIEHLLKCLDVKDERIREVENQCVELIDKINFHAEDKLKELLALCMTISNASAEERLGCIRKQYKEIWNTLNTNP